MTISRKTLRYVVLFGVLVWFLYLVNSGIIRTERSIDAGTLVYFDLAPRDPRSLIQGDYMTLRYAIEAEALQAYRRRDATPTDEQIVVQLDDNRVAHFARFYEGGTLAGDERLVNYRVRDGRSIHIGVDSFFFQEGLADVYADARYAEVRLNDGNVFLIDLVGEDFQPLTNTTP